MDSGTCSNSESFIPGSISGMVHNDWLVRHKGRDLDRMAEVYGCAKSTLTNVSASVSSFERWYKNYSPRIELTERKIFEICPAELDAILVDFFNTIKKPNGDEYNPSSLRSLRTNLARYLKENFYPCSIVTSDPFHRSRCAFKSKMQVLEFGVRSMYLSSAPVPPRSDFDMSCSSSGETLPAQNPDTVYSGVRMPLKNFSVPEEKMTILTQLGNTSNVDRHVTGFNLGEIKIQNNHINEENVNQSTIKREIVNFNMPCQNTTNTNTFGQIRTSFNLCEKQQTSPAGNRISYGQMTNEDVLAKGPFLRDTSIVIEEMTHFDILDQKPIIQEIIREEMTNFTVLPENSASTSLQSTIGADLHNASYNSLE